MAVSVVMPALEMAQETGKLVSWLKLEGEAVKKGEMLLEVETDKAVVEVEAATDGILAGITAQVGDVVPVGQTIAWLVQPGEKPPTTSASVQTGRTGGAASSVASSPSNARADSSSNVGADSSTNVGADFSRPEGAVRISPKARKLAREHGVDINQIKGSGPGGEILADDILAVGRLKSAPTAANTTDAGAGFSRPEPVSSIGRLMAERTTHSWTTVPHFFVARDVDATALNAAREKMIAPVEQSHGVKVTHTDVIVSAVARALKKHPRMNASWTGDLKVSGYQGAGIRLNDDVNVALAMAVENAVVTAVIRNADRAAIGEIAVQRRELAQRAKANRLQPADITGATFTISNLGMFGVDAFTAIIVPPQAGILAVGAIADRVVAINGEPRVRPMMTITLSSDHRVVDGARAAEFLNEVVTALQNAGADL